MAINWQCPFCGHNSTLTNHNISSSGLTFDNNNKFDCNLRVLVTSIVCPNLDCREVILDAKFGTSINAGGYTQVGEVFEEWLLRPSSLALVFPEYVPAAIRQDYEEACKIRNLSPKASATLSRRCLQGIIRDFKKNL